MSSNPLLWSHLRPSTCPAASVSSLPLVPENKTNTSLRVVLHDTKSALEQFSDRLGKLVDGVEHAKRDIDKVSSSFANGHDKVLEELNAAVNRSQRGLLETLGSPAQAIVLEEVKLSQEETSRKLALLEDKAELVQRLHAISEQQGHILTSLAAITPLSPLLKDSPQQQNQIISMLTSLLPVLPILQSFPAQVKAFQQEALDCVIKSIAEMGRSAAVSSPSPHKRKESCVSASDFLPGKPSKVSGQEVVDERLSGSSANGKRHASGRTLSSETSHSSCFPVFSTNSPLQQPVTMSGPKLLRTLPSLSGPKRSKPVSASSGLESRNPSVDVQPQLMAESENENSRDPKRQRLALDVDTHSKDKLPYRTASDDPITPSHTLDNTALHEQLRPGAIVGKAFHRNNSSRPGSIYRDPTPTVRAPAVVNSLQPTVPGGVPGVSPRMPAPALRPQRSMTMGQVPLTANGFLLSTPPFTRRLGFPPRINTPTAAIRLESAETPSRTSKNHVDRLDERASSTGLHARKQLIRRNSQQRKLLNEDADEDVDIDLDWGDVASS